MNKNDKKNMIDKNLMSVIIEKISDKKTKAFQSLKPFQLGNMTISNLFNLIQNSS